MEGGVILLAGYLITASISQSHCCFLFCFVLSTVVNIISLLWLPPEGHTASLASCPFSSYSSGLTDRWTPASGIGRQQELQLGHSSSLLVPPGHSPCPTSAAWDPHCALLPAELRKQVESAELKNQRLKEVFQTKIQEFRKVCYTLTGYQIDVTTESQYRLTSRYAEHQTDCLIFKVGSTVCVHQASSFSHRQLSSPPH